MRVSEELLHQISDHVKASGELSLNNLIVTDFDDALKLSDLVQGHLKSYISEVRLTNVKWRNKNLIKVFLHAICECASVQSFGWTSSAMTIDEVEEFDVLLCDTKSLRRLDFSGNGMVSASMQVIMRPFTLSPADLSPQSSLFSLTSLNLSNNNIGDQGVLVICRALLQFSRRAHSNQRGFSLEELYLDNNALSDKSAFCLAQLLNAKPSATKSGSKAVPMPIKVLSIGDNMEITCDGITALLGDSKIGTVSPLQKLLAPRCKPSVNVLKEISSSLTAGLIPRLEVLDLSFSENGASEIVEFSGANFNRIHTPLTAESLSKSLKLLSDALLMTSQPGPSRNGPKFSPSKSKVVLQRIELGELPRKMFDTCCGALNRGLLAHRPLYQDCLLALESINPAAKFFGIQYVANIAAWVEEGKYDNRKFVEAPPSVGDRFASFRSAKAEKAHVARIRDSSPQPTRQITNEAATRTSSPTAASPPQGFKTIANQPPAAAEQPPPTVKPPVPVAPETQSPTRQLFQSELDKTTTIPSSPAPVAGSATAYPESPTFKQALSMSESLKSAIKDLTQRVKASQAQLQHSIQHPKATAVYDTGGLAASNVASVSELNTAAAAGASRAPVASSLPMSTMAVSVDSEHNKPPDAHGRDTGSAVVSAEAIKSIVEETLQKFLSTANGSHAHSAALATAQTSVPPLPPPPPAASMPPPPQVHSPYQRGTTSHWGSPSQAHVPAAHLSMAAPAVPPDHPAPPAPSTEQMKVLDYLHKTRDELRWVLDDFRRSQHQTDASEVNKLQDRLNSVEQLLYFHFRNEQDAAAAAATTTNRGTAAAIAHDKASSASQRRTSTGDIFETNPLARRMISSLVNSAASAPLSDPAVLTQAIQHQRQDDKRLVYFEDIEQRLDLIEHLLQFDQQLQDEQEQVASRLSQREHPARSGVSAGRIAPVPEVADSLSRRSQRRQMIEFIQHQQQQQQSLYDSTMSYGGAYGGAYGGGGSLGDGGGYADAETYDTYDDILGYAAVQPTPSRRGRYAPATPSYRDEAYDGRSAAYVSRLNDTSRQFITERAAREEEIESVYSVPKRRRPGASPSPYGGAAYSHSSMPPPPPSAHRSRGRSEANLPPLPFMTPGFLGHGGGGGSVANAPMAPPPPGDWQSTASTMQERWRAITPTIAKTGTVFLTPMRHSNASVVSSSGSARRPLSLQHPDGSDGARASASRSRSTTLMQSTTSSAMKSNVHLFHDVHHQHGPHWTPNGIATNNHADNASPPIDRRRR
eukprot:gene4731-3391_t